MAGLWIYSMLEWIKVALLYGWWLILLIWMFVLKYKYKPWPVEAVIIEKRGDNLIKTNDRAGRYIDPYTKVTGYKLQKAGDTIPVLNYDWVLHNVYKPTTLSEKIVHFLRGNIGTIFLFRYGSKQYKPIKIDENGQTKTIMKEVLGNDGKPIMINVYQPFDPRDKLGALDFEVVDWDNMNFMVQEQRASIERRTKKTAWMAQFAVPIAALAITAIICIIAIKLTFDYAGTISPQKNTQTTSNIAEPPNIPVISDVIPGT